MQNTRYSEAEAELNFLKFSGLTSMLLAVLCLSNFAYQSIKQLSDSDYWMGTLLVLGAVLFVCLIVTFFSLINNGLEMRRRSFWRFQFEDEYVANLSRSADLFAGMTCKGLLLCAFVLTDHGLQVFGISAMTIHDFSQLVLGLCLLAYALPILHSIWKKDE